MVHPLPEGDLVWAKCIEITLTIKKQSGETLVEVETVCEFGGWIAKSR